MSANGEDWEYSLEEWSAFDIDECRAADWERLGVEPEFAAQWAMDPLDAAEWVAQGFSPQDAHTWLDLVTDANAACRWVWNHYDTSEVTEIYRTARDPLTDHSMWALTGLGAHHIRVYVAAGLSPEQAADGSVWESARVLAALAGVTAPADPGDSFSWPPPNLPCGWRI